MKASNKLRKVFWDIFKPGIIIPAFANFKLFLSLYRATNSTSGSSWQQQRSLTLVVCLAVKHYKIYFKSHVFFTFQCVGGPVWVRSIETYSGTWCKRRAKMPRSNFRALYSFKEGGRLEKSPDIVNPLFNLPGGYSFQELLRGRSSYLIKRRLGYHFSIKN